MTTIYFLRHGKTELNAQGRFQGAVCDGPLLPKSIENARSAGRFLADKNITNVWVSPLPRAVITTKAVLSQWKNQPEVQLVDGFRELDFGKLDGKIFADYANTPAIQAFRNAPANYDPSEFGGESYYDLATRSQRAFFAQVNVLQNMGDVLIVAHAITITTLVTMLLYHDVSRIRENGIVSNTSVTALKTNNFKDFSLLFWNKTDFFIC